MPRIAITRPRGHGRRTGRVYDAAAAKKSPVGGPYYAYIRLPKLFDGAQALREKSAGWSAVAARAGHRRSSRSRAI